MLIKNISNKVHIKLLPINSVSNFRDVSIGSKMKKNLLFRCAKLSTLKSKDIDILEKANLYAIIDFRDPKEIKKAGPQGRFFYA